MGTPAVRITSQKNLMSVTFKPDGDLVGADNYGAIRQWRVDDGVEVSRSEMKFNRAVYAAVVSADGQWIVTSGSGSSIVIWSATTHQRVLEVADHGSASYVCTVDVSSDSKLFASGSHDHTVRIFDIISGARLIPPLHHNSRVIGVKFSPDTSRVATAIHNPAFVGVYNTYSGDKLFDVQVGAGRTPTTPLAWSADGQQLFATSPGKITYFDTTTSSRSEWPIHDLDSVQVSIIASGKFIACSAGTSVTFWDPSSHERIGQTVSYDAAVTCIAISFDGRYLASGHSTGITVHKLQEFLPERYLSGISRLPLMQVSETVMTSWMFRRPAETESILSEDIAQCSSPSHYTYAARALMRAHLGEWKTAIEDAATSLKIKLSPIGQIAMSIALAGDGEQEAALDDFDLAFRECDLGDIKLLLVIKSILVFVCHKRKQAISRLRNLIALDDGTTGGYYCHVLGNMYVKEGDYENAVQTLALVNNPSTAEERGPLMTISLMSIFNWNFDTLKLTAWERLCGTLYASGSVKEVGETLLKMVSHLPEDEKEAVHGQILQKMITRSRRVTLLAWIGKSSTCNSCLPSSPAVYGDTRLTLAPLEGDALEKRTAALRPVFPVADAMVAYDRITCSQPVRFTHFRLHLPCIVFRVRGLQREHETVYRAKTAALGDVELTTTDALSLKEARKLVLVNPWIHLLREACGSIVQERDTDSDSDVGSSTDVDVDGGADADPDTASVRASMIEEVPITPLGTDTYTQALRLVACLGQPFSALLLLRQQDGAYRRVAADNEITIRGVGNGVDVPRDIRVEVLEVV